MRASELEPDVVLGDDCFPALDFAWHELAAFIGTKRVNIGADFYQTFANLAKRTHAIAIP